MKEHQLKPETNAKKEEVENQTLRRFHRILNMPTTDLAPPKNIQQVEPGCKFCLGVKPITEEQEEDDEFLTTCNCKGFMSVCHKSIYFEQECFRDTLIQLAQYC